MVLFIAIFWENNCLKIYLKINFKCICIFPNCDFINLFYIC